MVSRHRSLQCRAGLDPDSVQVVSAERIVDKLLRLAKKWGSACQFHAWGTICVCPQKGSPNQGRHAHCKCAHERGPVFSQATVATCGRCPYAVHTERFESAAKATLADQEALDTGLSDGTLLRNFVSSLGGSPEGGSVRLQRWSTAPPESSIMGD